MLQYQLAKLVHVVCGIYREFVRLVAVIMNNDGRQELPLDTWHELLLCGAICINDFN